MNAIRVILKPEKEKPIRARHPWIFSGAIDQVDDNFKAGDLTRVYSSDHQFLGIGYLNPRSQIAVRMLSFEDEAIDLKFFIKRFSEAKSLRDRLMPSGTNVFRLVHSEGDFLPGLVVDRYADHLVAQFLTAGMEALKPLVVEALQAVFPVKGIYEHDDKEARRLEGLEENVTLLAGEEPPDYVEVEECGHRFLVDVKRGQKTGFFIDQRENRMSIAALCEGKKVLNCFAYTGAFSVYAARAGASAVVSVEIQERAFNTMQSNFELNGLLGDAYRFVREDVFDYLRGERASYDVIILDPPAFCKNAGHVQQAARGYKDVNLQAMKRTAPGGILLTCSCSSYIEPALFQKIIFGAAKDAGRAVQILKKTSHPFDHPINVYHPEGEYLKGLYLKVI